MFDPRESAGVRRLLLGGQPAAHRAVRRGRAGRAGGRATGSSPSWRRTRCSPTPSSRPPAASTCRWPHWPPCGASRSCRTGCAAFWPICTARVPRWTSRCSIPAGRLVDAPLPTWTHRPLLLTRGRSGSQARGGSHRCRASAAWGACAFAGAAGTPRLAGRGRHRGAALAGRPPGAQRRRPAGAAYCEMALAAARTVLGEASEVRDVRFEQMLLLDDADPGRRRRVGGLAGRRQLRGGDLPRRGARAAGHRTPARRRGRRPSRPRMTWPLCWRRTRATWMAPSFANGSMSAVFSTGPAFAGLAAAHTAEGTGATVLAEVALPGSIRSQQPLRGAPRAAGCLLPVGGGSSQRRERSQWRSAAAAGRAPATRLRFHPQRPLLLHAADQSRRDAEVEADLDVLDEHGTVLLSVRGLQMGTGDFPKQRTRSRAQRAAAHHRMAAAGAARGGARRCRSVAAGQHLHNRRCGGERADRCVETQWRAMHVHVLAAARRPLFEWRSVAQPAPSRSIRRPSGPDGTEERRPRRARCVPRRRVRAASGAHRPRVAGDPRRARLACTS